MAKIQHFNLKNLKNCFSKLIFHKINYQKKSQINLSKYCKLDNATIKQFQSKLKDLLKFYVEKINPKNYLIFSMIFFAMLIPSSITPIVVTPS